MNQKGFANIVLIILVVVLVGALGYITLVKKPAPAQQPQSNTISPNSPVNTLQLTKSQVLNGYDQCGIQFKEGELSVGFDKYQQLELTCSTAVSSASISASAIVLADLDNDGILEAITPVRIVRASSGGALYIFKNINGVARVADSVIIGKENIDVVSVNGNTIVGKTDGAMGYIPTIQTYKFVNGKLIKQSTTPLPSLPTTCVDQQEGTPVITSLSSYSGSVGTKLEIRGCNFNGFEGDKNAWIENAQGVKGLLSGEAGSTGKLLKVTLKSPLCQKDTSYSGLPCDASLDLTPGTYNIYTMPWGKKSNVATFTIK